MASKSALDCSDCKWGIWQDKCICGEYHINKPGVSQGILTLRTWRTLSNVLVCAILFSHCLKLMAGLHSLSWIHDLPKWAPGQSENLPWEDLLPMVPQRPEQPPLMRSSSARLPQQVAGVRLPWARPNLVFLQVLSTATGFTTLSRAEHLTHDALLPAKAYFLNAHFKF